MSTAAKSLAAVLAFSSVLAPAVSHAAANDPLACSIQVEHTAGGAQRFTYTKDFVVSTAAAFSDDFSSGTRVRTFEASVHEEAGAPVVTFELDLDVSAFAVVGVEGSLKVHDAVSGERTTGSSSFADSNNSHLVRYTLTCQQSAN